MGASAISCVGKREAAHDGGKELSRHSEAAAAGKHYLAHGWSILPLRARDKQPLMPWTHLQTRPPSEEEVAEWFCRWPDANIRFRRRLEQPQSLALQIGVESGDGATQRQRFLPIEAETVGDDGRPQGEHWRPVDFDLVMHAIARRVGRRLRYGMWQFAVLPESGHLILRLLRTNLFGFCRLIAASERDELTCPALVEAAIAAFYINLSVCLLADPRQVEFTGGAPWRPARI